MAFPAFLTAIMIAAFTGVFLMIRRSLRDQLFWLTGEIERLRRELAIVEGQAATAAAAADRAARIITVATRPNDDEDPEARFLRAHATPLRWPPSSKGRPMRTTEEPRERALPADHDDDDELDAL